MALICRFDNIKLHEFIVMPNHFHGIVKFVGVPLVGTQNVGQPQGIAPTVGDESKSLSVVYQEKMPNHLELHPLRAVVVSVKGKGGKIIP